MSRYTALFIGFFYLAICATIASEAPEDSNPERVIGPTSQQAEIFVFPVKPQKPTDAWKCPDSFDPDKFRQKNEADNEAKAKTSEIRDELKEEKPVEPLETIAIFSQSRDFFHSMNSSCISKSQQRKAKTASDIHKLMPCHICFIRADKPPGFISEESGGLDLASATNLLSNDEFIEWMNRQLPVKEPKFSDDHELETYPAEPMSKKAMQKLAKEIALAARRHMWRVIRVKVKDSKDTGQTEISF